MSDATDANKVDIQQKEKEELQEEAPSSKPTGNILATKVSGTKSQEKGLTSRVGTVLSVETTRKKMYLFIKWVLKGIIPRNICVVSEIVKHNSMLLKDRKVTKQPM